jgi:hypothetical protein
MTTGYHIGFEDIGHDEDCNTLVIGCDGKVALNSLTLYDVVYVFVGTGPSCRCIEVIYTNGRAINTQNTMLLGYNFYSKYYVLYVRIGRWLREGLHHAHAYGPP